MHAIRILCNVRSCCVLALKPKHEKLGARWQSLTASIPRALRAAGCVGMRLTALSALTSLSRVALRVAATRRAALGWRMYHGILCSRA